MQSKILRYIAYILEIIIFYIVEQTPNLIPSVIGVKPTLVIPILIMISLFEEEKVGLIFGLFIGILLDIRFSSGIGFYTIVIPMCGYIIGLLSKSVIKSTFSTAMIISSITIFLIFSLQFIFCYLILGYNNRIYAFIHHYFPMIIYTFLTSILFYYLNKTFALPIHKD